ncbi:MAG: MFS transporter [Chloroflexi bacterium]|nr:MFS transporter [Chloroflexota bacterium]
MIQRIATSSAYKWWNFWTIALGTFFSVVDHGSVLIALPGIESHFDATLESVQWVVISYALVISVLLLPMGRLGDVVGRRRVYITGTAIFVVASLAATFAPTLEFLIAMRVCKGIGAGMVQGCGMGMMLAAFTDAERGKALGTHLSVVGLGAIAGPAMGGFLVAWLGWQSVFFVNVPAGCIVLVLSWFLLERGPAVGGSERPRSSAFDWIGAATSGIILLVLLLVVGNGNSLGWLSAPVIVGAAVVAILMGVFVWWELKTAAPMLDLRLFADRVFGIGAASAWLSFFGTSAARFLMPFYLQRVLGYAPEQVGLMMIPAALCMVILGPPSGRLSDRFGWHVFTVVGLSMSAAGALLLAFALQERSAVWFVIATMMLQSSGNAVFNSPNSSSIISVVDRSRYGVVSALTQLIRNSANVVSVAVSTTIVVSTMATYGVEPKLEAVDPSVATAFVAGLRWAYLAMGCAVGTGVVISIYRAITSRRPTQPAAPVQPAEPSPSASGNGDD